MLFGDTNRFRPVIYNNLKGSIVAIEAHEGRIQFDVRLAQPVTELDVEGYFDLDWVADSTVRFSVYESTLAMKTTTRTRRQSRSRWPMPSASTRLRDLSTTR